MSLIRTASLIFGTLMLVSGVASATDQPAMVMQGTHHLQLVGIADLDKTNAFLDSYGLGYKASPFINPATGTPLEIAGKKVAWGVVGTNDYVKAPLPFRQFIFGIAIQKGNDASTYDVLFVKSVDNSAAIAQILRDKWHSGESFGDVTLDGFDGAGAGRSEIVDGSQKILSFEMANAGGIKIPEIYDNVGVSLLNGSPSKYRFTGDAGKVQDNRGSVTRQFNPAVGDKFAPAQGTLLSDVAAYIGFMPMQWLATATLDVALYPATF